MPAPSTRGAIHSVSASHAVSMVSAEKFGRSPATHSLQAVAPSASSSSSSRIRRPVVRPEEISNGSRSVIRISRSVMRDRRRLIGRPLRAIGRIHPRMPAPPLPDSAPR